MWEASRVRLACVLYWIDVNRREGDEDKNTPEKYGQDLGGFELDKFVVGFGCTDRFESEILNGDDIYAYRSSEV